MFVVMFITFGIFFNSLCGCTLVCHRTRSESWMAGIAHIFRALGALCILPCPPVLWAFNKLWCQKVYVNCLMKLATCASLLFWLFVDNKGVKTCFISSPT